MITGHGDDSYRLTTSIKADFSSNVWFGGPSPELIAHLQQNLHLIGNYPEPDAFNLCQTIAESLRINHNQVLAFNGSVEAFYTIALAFREKHSAILVPAFAEYADACRMHNHEFSFFCCKDGLQGTELCWIGNPNNPDGHIFSVVDIEDFLQQHPQTILIVDEAYSDFIPEFRSAIELTDKFENLIVVRSLTKCCAIPGLRLGYVVTSATIAELLRQYQQPWSVNVLAQIAGKFLIEKGILSSFDSVQMFQLSQQLQEEINSIGGFTVYRSQTPYFLVEMQSGTAAELKEYLIQEHGILIRDASNFRALNERYFRVCTRNESDNQLLIDGLKNYMRNK